MNYKDNVAEIGYLFTLIKSLENNLNLPQRYLNFIYNDESSYEYLLVIDWQYMPYYEQNLKIASAQNEVM